MPPKSLKRGTPGGTPLAQTGRSDLSGTTSMSMNGTESKPNPLTSFGIWVAVRVRPFNKMEMKDTTGKSNNVPQPVVELESDRKTMTLLDPSSFQERCNFAFDFCFSPFLPSVVIDDKSDDSDSSDEDEEAVAERAQADIYRCIGAPIVEGAWSGYNSCIFAYGQTSSGKTYTMMGTKRDPGIIPRLCRDLFEKIEGVYVQEVQCEGKEAEADHSRKVIKVSLSYMEIYNERVKDLLKQRPKDKRLTYKNRFDVHAADEGEYQNLRVRQHPLHGPFVDGLTKIDVSSWLECVRCIRQGNEFRSQASTHMNESSSRSHAIFQLTITQTEALGAKVRGKEIVNHRVSKLNLVDLAGSERTSRTGVTGKHATEANYINQSLSTLRKVIDVLVTKKRPGATVVVPYRESMLTWILADNFGGNSKTAMIAAVSPHRSNASETESTLRYATLAKGIVNRVRVNEDPSAKLIRELRTQLQAMQTEMQSGGAKHERVSELEDQIEENKRAMDELLAREQGMRMLIDESRQREEELRQEKDELAAERRRWKLEAEQLRKEKNELRTMLQRVSEGRSGELASLNKDNFWLEAEASQPGNTIQTAEAGDSSCPPGQGQLLRRRSRKLSRAGSARGSPHAPSASGHVMSGRRASLPWEAPPLPPTDESPPPADSRPVSQTPTEGGARFGRRAMTGDGVRRSPGTPSISADTPPAQTPPPQHHAFTGDKAPGSAGSVPLSLQHLVGVPTTQPTKSAPSGGARPSPVPDALDSFLSGTGDDPKPGRARGVPPWRQKPKARK